MIDIRDYDRPDFFTKVAEAASTVFQEHGIALSALAGRARDRRINAARARFCQLLRRAGFSNPAIGLVVKRNHGTVAFLLNSPSKPVRGGDEASLEKALRIADPDGSLGLGGQAPRKPSALWREARAKLWVRLHLDFGWSARQIAQRFRTSSSSVRYRLKAIEA